MSRSRKKTPFSSLAKSKYMKKLANRRIRRLLKDSEINMHGKDYRKYFNSWDICDYKEMGCSSFESYVREAERMWFKFWYPGKKKRTREELYKDYLKWYLRK